VSDYSPPQLYRCGLNKVARLRTILDGYLLSMASDSVVSAIVGSLECRKKLLQVETGVDIVADILILLLSYLPTLDSQTTQNSEVPYAQMTKGSPHFLYPFSTPNLQRKPCYVLRAIRPSIFSMLSRMYGSHICATFD
jgi:hypothetical protein